MTTNKSLRTDGNVQGNLLRNHEQKIENLPYHLQLFRKYSNVRITKTVAKGLYFTTLRNWTAWEAHVESIHPSRQRSIQSERMDPWEHEDRSSFGGGSQSSSMPLRNRDHGRILVGDGTCSWVMTVNGINKYVTEMTEETQDDHIDYIGDCTGKLVAKTRPKQTSIPTTSSATTTLPCHLRVWIDVEPALYDKSCFRGVKKDDQIAST